MDFYTCCNRYGDSILYRGYSDGKRVSRKVKFSPTMFIQSSSGESTFKSIDGVNVEPHQFLTIKECKDFIQQYSQIDNFTIYGNSNYVSQFIYSEFPGDISFDQSLINTTTIDIEVMSDNGFPFPDLADQPITAITIKASTEKEYHVWGLGEYDTSKTILKNNPVVYHKCDNEKMLLKSFLGHWESEKHCPDAITGWNTRLFDIPYLVNRIIKVLGENESKRLSPWKKINYRQINVKNKSLDTYEIFGIQQLDYLDLFQKFAHSYGTQESYKLDHIASIVLGENKLSYDDHINMFGLLKSAEDVKISESAPINKLDDLQKACLLRDRLRNEKNLRGLS